MKSIAEDVKDILELSASTSGLTFGTDLFVGVEPDIKNQTVPIITVYNSGGESPQTVMSTTDIEKPSFQIRVRAARLIGYEDATALIYAVRDDLHKFTNQVVNGTRYIKIMQSGDVLPLGNDDNNRPLFTLNFISERTQ